MNYEQTLQDALDYVSLNLYNCYFDILKYRQPATAVMGAMESAAELFAESKAKEAWNAACQLQINNCLDALRPTFSDSLAYGDVASAKYPDYETYKTKQNA